jgi:hypothetical protein
MEVQVVCHFLLLVQHIWGAQLIFAFVLKEILDLDPVGGHLDHIVLQNLVLRILILIMIMIVIPFYLVV